MIKYLPLLFIVLTILSVSPAISIAEEPAADDPCAEALTTVEMRECLNTHYTKEDGELNHVYRQVMSQKEKAREWFYNGRAGGGEVCSPLHKQYNIF